MAATVKQKLGGWRVLVRRKGGHLSQTFDLRKDAAHGGTHKYVDRMLTRAELYDVIGLHGFEDLDASIIKIIVPEGAPQ